MFIIIIIIVVVLYLTLNDSNIKNSDTNGSSDNIENSWLDIIGEWNNYNSTNDLESKTIYQYNQNDDLVKLEKYDRGIKLSYYETYEYEYY